MINLPDKDIDLAETTTLITQNEMLEDFRIACRSRNISLLGRQEVLSGRAKFGIFGDGKEIPQVALAHFFKKGDFRSGYYRDQTLMLALGEITVRTFFAQLYSHADIQAEPASGGRMMNAHFVSHSLNPDGSWNDLTKQYNTAADISPTAGQMPRLVGLAYASRLYREIEELKRFSQFSHNGDEIAFGTIGNASTSEGMFWESINAIGVLGAPAVVSIWDDGYGISVPNKYQMTKGDLTELLSGFQRQNEGGGYDIYPVNGWDYRALVNAYHRATVRARADHIPAIIHVTGLTQPQGHSTSGSHERYKSADQLQWEAEHDCLLVMRQWLIEEEIATEEQLSAIEEDERNFVRKEQKAAWQAFVASVNVDRKNVKHMIEDIASQSAHAKQLEHIKSAMTHTVYPKRRDLLNAVYETLKLTRDESIPAKQALIQWRDYHKNYYQKLYSSDIYSETPCSPLNVREVKPTYADDAEQINGFAILNQFFKSALERDPRIIAFGEDVGYLGGVNQGMAGLQAEFGELRVSDTGIRETTIVGQAIGLALRGLRPIAEIQYLDYILYALQTLSDDLATLRWRTKGGQAAPVIIRTRGHRLEGVWHSGSPMGSLINLLRGVNILVPRDMTRAAGFYNTLLRGDDPGIVVEVLNSYRKKEALPENLTNITVPIGVPETLREGHDITLVTYGAMCPIVMEAADDLSELGIEAEVIDVQSLLPFDIHHHIVESLKKTSRIVCIDEDVPGGATAYMMQHILEQQGGYHWLDSEPRTITGTPHRPAYGSDGDYFSKPNKHTIVDVVYDMMNEVSPKQYPFFDKLEQR